LSLYRLHFNGRDAPLAEATRGHSVAVEIMDMPMGASLAPRRTRPDALRENARRSVCWGMDAMKEMINPHIESVGTGVEPPLAAVPINSRY
jgi:hypothetical protein